MSAAKAVLLAALATAPAAASAAPLDLEPYGFVRASVVGADRAVESYGQPNLSAYTAAANPALAPSPRAGRASFQYAQSRVGAVVRRGPASGRLEFDFVDFTKASPTTKAQPRVRRAAIDWKPGDEWTLRAGQDWDLVSPLAPHTDNPVGHYFESGDIAFMRVQAMALKKAGEREHGLALGMTAANNRASDSGVELGAAPTLALRETLSAGGWTLAASAIGASLRPDAGGGRYFAGAAAVSASGRPGGVELRGEAYAALNAFDLGLQGLGTRGDGGTSVGEAGGYATAKLALDPKNSLFGGAGAAWIVNSAAQPAAYALGAAGAAANGRGTGMLSNATARLGWERVLADGLYFWAEAARLWTAHRAAGGGVAGAGAEVLESGIQFNFGA